MNKWVGSFIAVIVLEGILQFFEGPKWINYGLLIIAVLLGIMAIISRRSI